MRLLPILLALAATSAPAFHPDYLPLRVGNQWIYRQQGIGQERTITLEVVRVGIFEQRAYTLVTGFPGGDAWLRLEKDGTLIAWDADAARRMPWIPFAAPLGEVFSTEIDQCNNTGRIATREGRVSSPVGNFNTALEVTYSTTCADAGLTSDFFLPYVGLLRRVETTIAGPRTWELVYARLGGVTFVSEPGLGVSLTLNQAVFEPGEEEPPVLRARITLRNHHLDPVTLNFPSGQRSDLIIRDANGTIVYKWSDGKAFTQALATEELPNGEKNYLVRTPLAADTGPLPPGIYAVEAWITTSPPARYGASATFEIRP